MGGVVVVVVVGSGAAFEIFEASTFPQDTDPIEVNIAYMGSNPPPDTDILVISETK